MSVTPQLGCGAAGVVAGLKTSGERDVAVVINDGPSRAAAAVFTANRVQAAPVTWTRQVVSGGRVRAVVLNSGGAHACPRPAGVPHTPPPHPGARGGRGGAGRDRAPPPGADRRAAADGPAAAGRGHGRGRG